MKDWTVKYGPADNGELEKDFKSFKQAKNFAIKMAQKFNSESYVDECIDGYVNGTKWWTAQPNGTWEAH